LTIKFLGIEGNCYKLSFGIFINKTTHQYKTYQNIKCSQF